MRVFNFFSGLFLTLTLAGCAQRLDDVEERMEAMQKRIAQIESKAGLPIGSDKELLDSQRLADTRSQVGALRNEVTVLSGRVEAAEFEMKGLNQRVNALQTQLERKSIEAESTPAPAPVAQDGPTKTASEEELLYTSALKAHQEGDFEGAQKMFENFLSKFRSSSYRDNALFWLGEGFMAREMYRRAITRYQDLIENYPKSDKKCDALSRQIIALKELKMDKEAKAFEDFRKKECK